MLLLICYLENKSTTEKTDTNDTTTINETNASSTDFIEEIATTSVNCDNQLITANVNVEPDRAHICVENFEEIASKTAAQLAITTENTDPVPDSVDLEANRIAVKNSLLSTNEAQVLDSVAKRANNTTTDINADLSSLDAALDNLTEQVTSLLDENSGTKLRSNSPEAPLDAALATLNNEVLGLLQESRKIQDELKKANDASREGSRAGSKAGSVSGSRGGLNQYFDYSLYRERSISPPPHPINTYKWEDIRREKERVSLMCD